MIVFDFEYNIYIFEATDKQTMGNTGGSGESNKSTRDGTGGKNTFVNS